jgi:hypothetical protein
MQKTSLPTYWIILILKNNLIKSGVYSTKYTAEILFLELIY